MSDKFAAFKRRMQDDKFRKKFDALFFRMIDEASTPGEAGKSREEFNKLLAPLGLSVRDLPELMAGHEDALFDKIWQFLEDDVSALLRLAREGATFFCDQAKQAYVTAPVFGHRIT